MSLQAPTQISSKSVAVAQPKALTLIIKSADTKIRQPIAYVFTSANTNLAKKCCRGSAKTFLH